MGPGHQSHAVSLQTRGRAHARAHGPGPGRRTAGPGRCRVLGPAAPPAGGRGALCKRSLCLFHLFTDCIISSHLCSRGTSVLQSYCDRFILLNPILCRLSYVYLVFKRKQIRNETHMPPFFPNQILQVERRGTASEAQAAGLANGGSGREPPRGPSGLLSGSIRAFGEGGRRGSSKHIHVLALYQRAPGICRPFPHLSSPGPFAKREAGISPKSRSVSAVIPRPLGVPPAIALPPSLGSPPGSASRPSAPRGKAGNTGRLLTGPQTQSAVRLQAPNTIFHALVPEQFKK